MFLRIYNKTNAIISYLSGQVVVPALGFINVDPKYFNQLEVDPQLRNDLVNNKVDISDTVTRYGNNDGIKQLDFMAGLRDDRGNGITSTQIISGTDIHHALDVNLVNGISISVLPDNNVNTVLKYNELLMVPSGSEQILLSYTVPPATTTILQKASVSGENIALYKINYNSSTIATKRTYFTYLNENFDFLGTLNNGFIMQAGDLIEITVLQNRPNPANFESTLQIVEVT